MAKRLPYVHPGEVLREDYLVPMKLAPYTLAKALGVPRTRIERLAREETPVTADTALRLARYFGTTPAFWMDMQASTTSSAPPTPSPANSNGSRRPSGRPREFQRAQLPSVYITPLRQNLPLAG